MRGWVVRTLLIVCTLALSLGHGSGLASAADPFVGKKYSDAAAGISKRNGTPVVATVSGSALELDDCIVTSWSQSLFLDSSGSNRRSTEYRLNLNCNNPVAEPGHPGNSAMTPQGIAAKKEQKTAANINKNPEWCQQSDKNMETCVKFCNSNGLCEVPS